MPTWKGSSHERRMPLSAEAFLFIRRPLIGEVTDDL
jgi:hypothetical protein